MQELEARREERRRLQAQIEESFGPAKPWLENLRVMNIMCNPDGHLWIDSYEEGMVDTGVRMSALQVEAALAVVASALDEEINARRPILEGELPDGSRIEAWVPPVSETPCFSIRKHAPLIPFGVYLQDGIVTAHQAEVLRHALTTRQNLLIIGLAGSGKTTFLSALLDEQRRLLPPSERFVVLEDTRELRLPGGNVLRLRTKRAPVTAPAHQDVTLHELVKSALRTPIGRLIVGEVRGGPETLEMLEAWGTGHPGIATVHAADPHAAFTRLEGLVRRTGQTPDPFFLGQMVNLIVTIARVGRRSWRVTEIVHVEGYHAVEGYRCNQL
jgi:Flp pilus assembly CpaF family ATPase